MIINSRASKGWSSSQKIHLLTLVATFFANFVGEAANITWGPPMPITGTKDVFTNWSLERAYNFGAAKNKTNVTINGVTFKPFASDTHAQWHPAVVTENGTKLAVSGDGDGIYSADGIFGKGVNSLPLDYEKLLQSGCWNNGSVWALILDGLTVSNNYVIQLWVSDSQGANHVETFTGGTNCSQRINFNAASKPGGTGQYMMGFFTADKPSQIITFNPDNGPAQLNAFQLRSFAGVAPPVLVKSPVSLTNQAGNKANLTVQAWASTPVTYYWQKISKSQPGGHARTNFISGATSATLSFAALSTADEGEYQAVVLSQLGAIFSPVVSLTVIPECPWIWTGRVNGTWDIGGAANWNTKGTETIYVNDACVQFDDTAIITSVSNTTMVLPFAVIVTNTLKNYVIGGSPISGNTGLTKNGAGKLTLNGKNSYIGKTLIDSGTLVIGGDGQLGDGSYTNEIVNHGSFVYDSGAFQTLRGAITGDGSLIKSGTNTLELSGRNTFTGGTTVNAGTLIADTANGSTFGALGGGNVTVNAGGIVLANGDNSLIGGNPSGSKTIAINAGGVIKSAGTTSCHLNALLLDGGILAAQEANDNWGSWNFSYGVSTPGHGRISTIAGGNITLAQNGGTFFNIKAGDTLDVTAVIAHTRWAADTGLIKTGTGTLNLSAKNSFTNNLIVSNGSLNASSSLACPVLIQPDGTLAVGTPKMGTLTINNSVTLAGNIVLRIGKDQNGTANDQIGGLSSVNYGGTLTVTNVGIANVPPAEGDVFTLFKAANYSHSFARIILPKLPSNLKWDLSGLAVNGDIRIVNSGKL